MSILSCPVCKATLQQQGQSWRCSQNHSYDVAKQGYINLHVVQHKHSKQPGDTSEAVQARRAFLATGCYQPLQQAVLAAIQDLQTEGNGVTRILDIGCGEGYYTAAMRDVVQHCIGVDIAKRAVQVAAKTRQDVTWVVGTGATLPVLDHSLDLCSSLFSPIPVDEIVRVLKPKGYLLVVRPAAEHLYAMREALFEMVNLHEPDKIIAPLAADFALCQQREIRADLLLNQQQLKDLIAMTPYAYKAKAERRAALESMSSFALTACFQIYILQKL
ncbi:putative RNA methyltransferase [Acinetobacter larvae]|uniref:Methyltransferase n=1 Tax=Acinetobacter larvae TaxID=1789224 RepID=A0A1B2M2L8_9GAMM|nr:methyltransferase domain-containing protein [Acinetobacter larvae]AOA59446.1 methyltransferase [Acinetobacter larvae]